MRLLEFGADLGMTWESFPFNNPYIFTVPCPFSLLPYSFPILPGCAGWLLELFFGWLCHCRDSVPPCEGWWCVRERKHHQSQAVSALGL